MASTRQTTNRQSCTTRRSAALPCRRRRNASASSSYSVMGFLKMSAEIQLIHQIEQFPCLYNYFLPEYNRKDVIDDVWGQIAGNTQLTVNECREKWRNIRSSFLRSMKTNKSKLKKPYYLAEYLKFVVPFLKPVNYLETEETQPDTVISETEIELDLVKMEAEEYEEVHSECNGTGITDPLIAQRSTRKRRRFVPKAKNNSTDFLRVRRKIHSQRDGIHSSVDLTSDNNPMRMFLMSLLPELETMTEEQTRTFKIKTMMLVDDIKTNPQVKRNTNWDNSERLQKRLINLLLKNLNRTT